MLCALLITSINSCTRSSEKFTFVTHMNKPRFNNCTFSNVTSVACIARAKPINAAVNSSCKFATGAVLPHTPCTVQPFGCAVCSHWKQNILIITSLGTLPINMFPTTYFVLDIVSIHNHPTTGVHSIILLSMHLV